MMVLLWLTLQTSGGLIVDDRNYYGLGGIMPPRSFQIQPTSAPASIGHSKMMRNLRLSRHFHVSPEHRPTGENRPTVGDRDRWCAVPDRKSRRHNEHQLGDSRLYFV